MRQEGEIPFSAWAQCSLPQGWGVQMQMNSLRPTWILVELLQQTWDSTLIGKQMLWKKNRIRPGQAAATACVATICCPPSWLPASSGTLPMWVELPGLGDYLESPLDCKEIKPVNPKGNPPWIFIGRIVMPKFKLQCFGHLMWRPDSLEKSLPDAGKDWRQEEKGAMEDDMVGWHHGLHGHEFEQTSGDSERQRSLACCSSWGHKDLDTV